MAGFFNPEFWETTVPTPRLAKCGACGLAKTCLSPKMEMTGNPDSKVLFIAEAPGESEDREGIQLIGESGQLLRSILKELGKDLDDYLKTNAVICRPPKNKMDTKYIDACRPNLLKTIAKVKPKVIILLGGVAVESLLSIEWKKGIGPLARWIGWHIPSLQYHAWLCPTYHPSFLLRLNNDNQLRKILKQHLSEALKLEEKELPPYTLKSLEQEVEIVLDVAYATSKLKNLMERKGRLAFDFETTGLKPERKEQRIVSCSFCFEGADTFAMPLYPEVIPLLKEVLQNRKLRKVASNIKFEDRWTRKWLGGYVAGWYWDTMLAAHVIDNRAQISSIKFQSYIYFGVGDYSSHVRQFLEAPYSNDTNNIDRIDVETLLLYNGMDSLLEYMVMEKQTGILGFGKR